MTGGVPLGVLLLPGRDPALPLPAYASAQAAGADVCANLAPADRADGLRLAPGDRALVPTGGVPLGVLPAPGRDPALPLPAYASAQAAGADVCANLAPADRAAGLRLLPGDRALVPTGFALEIPDGYEAQLRPRSGLALRQGLTLLNSPGTIDADYRGEIGLIVINHGREAATIFHGMRVAQLVLAPVVRAAWRVVEAVGATERGAGGFGSTGLDPSRETGPA